MSATTPSQPPNKGALREIVAQVKSGAKDKTQAFAELKSILLAKSERSVFTSINQSINTPIATPSIARNDNSSNVNDNGSIADNDMQPPPPPQTPFDNETFSNEVSPVLHNPNTTAASINMVNTTDKKPSKKISVDDRRDMINKLINSNNNAMYPASEAVLYDSRSDSARYHTDSNNNSNNNSNNSSPTDSKKSSSFAWKANRTDAAVELMKANRIAHAEAIIRKEMFKECTFRPTIKVLPDHYGKGKEDDNIPFYHRVSKWQQEKEAEIDRKKQFMNKSEINDCTFHPRINRSSEKAVREIRGDVREDVADRLFKSNEVSFTQRAKFIEDELRREKEEEDMECTFHPHLVSKRYDNVKSKFDEPLQRNAVDPHAKELTFTPKVTGIKASMNSAQVYVSTNVVDRLTRGISASKDTDHINNKSVINASSYLGSLLHNSNPSSLSYSTPSSHHNSSSSSSSRSRPSSAPRERPSSSGSMSKEELNAKKQSFITFLARQQQSVAHKEKKVELYQEKHTPKFTPKICKKSIELMDANTRGEFLDRVDKDSIKRKDDNALNKSSEMAKCTFKPQISEKSTKLRPRSVHEMSNGDLLKRRSNQQIMQMRNEQEQMADLTFRPEISAKAKKINKSALKLSEDPSKVLVWYEEKMLKREEDIAKDRQLKYEQEVLECTFNPSIIDCPAYVRKIAKSMAVVKAAKSPSKDDTNNTSLDYIRNASSDMTGRPLWK